MNFRPHPNQARFFPVGYLFNAELWLDDKYIQVPIARPLRTDPKLPIHAPVIMLGQHHSPISAKPQSVTETILLLDPETNTYYYESL